MSPQIACLGRCIVTLVAFVWLFPTVRRQMSLQITCLPGCKLTEIALVWLFSCVSFYMCLIMADFWRFITTLLAFVFHIFWTAHLFNNKSVHPFCLSSTNTNLREYWEQNFESKSAVAGDGHDIMSRSKRNWLQQKTFIWINLKVGRFFAKGLVPFTQLVSKEGNLVLALPSIQF